MLVDELTQDDRIYLSSIAKLYLVLLGREPDVHGLKHFTIARRNGTSLVTIIESFFQGDEFRGRHPHFDPISTDDVRALYATAVGLPDQICDVADPASLLAAMIEADEVTGRSSMVHALRALAPRFANPLMYRWWSDEYGRATTANKENIADLISNLPQQHAFSLMMFVERSIPQQLSAAVQSVLSQSYNAVELTLIMRGPVDPPLAGLVQELRRSDDRVRVSVSSRWRTPASAWNKALSKSRGKFVGTLDSSDRVDVTATLEFAATALRWPDTQVMFCDEDVIGQDGLRCDPRFKSIFDLDRMLVENYTGKLTFVRRDLALRIGGWRAASAGAEDYDLALRATANLPLDLIRHVPHVLYHRRARPPLPTSASPTFTVSSAFLATTQPRTSIELAPPSVTGLVHPVPRVDRSKVSSAPFVSIIIPTRDRCDILRACVQSLLLRTIYPKFEIVIVDNGSTEPESVAFLASLVGSMLVRVIRFDGPFNWGAVNNAGVDACSGEVVVLLNNDTEVINSDWLQELVGQVMRPDVGAVGAKLLYPASGSLQHAGIVVSPNGAGRHVFRHSAGDGEGYLNVLSRVRSVSAVTGACIALRRTTLVEVGGIEETELQVTCSDVDLCFRVQDHGYRVIWTPFARLWHKELATRGTDDTAEKLSRAAKEESYLSRRWESKMRADPYWSPNLALDEKAEYLAVPPRGARAWEKS